MNPLAVRLSILAIAISALTSGAFYVRMLNAQREDLNHQIAVAMQAIVDRDHLINGLQEDAKRKAELQAGLSTTTQRVAQTVTTQHKRLEKVIHEHARTQDWASTPLPDDIERLSASPACTGAADYLRSLPDR